MGLDMYLTKKTYVQNWDHMKPEQRHEITVKLGGVIRADIKPERINYIEENVGYWRKANAIHKWFVDNVQDGKDECQDSYVTRDQLAELLELCQTVLESPEKAPELLPAQGGFFFGSTEYDDGYMDDVKSTIEIIKSVLAEPDTASYYYHASW